MSPQAQYSCAQMHHVAAEGHGSRHNACYRVLFYAPAAKRGGLLLLICSLAEHRSARGHQPQDPAPISYPSPEYINILITRVHTCTTVRS